MKYNEKTLAYYFEMSNDEMHLSGNWRNWENVSPLLGAVADGENML